MRLNGVPRLGSIVVEKAYSPQIERTTPMGLLHMLLLALSLLNHLKYFSVLIPEGPTQSRTVLLRDN